MTGGNITTCCFSSSQDRQNKPDPRGIYSEITLFRYVIVIKTSQFCHPGTDRI